MNIEIIICEFTSANRIIDFEIKACKRPINRECRLAIKYNLISPQWLGDIQNAQIIRNLVHRRDDLHIIILTWNSLGDKTVNWDCCITEVDIHNAMGTSQVWQPDYLLCKMWQDAAEGIRVGLPCWITPKVQLVQHPFSHIGASQMPRKADEQVMNIMSSPCCPLEVPPSDFSWRTQLLIVPWGTGVLRHVPFLNPSELKFVGWSSVLALWILPTSLSLPPLHSLLGHGLKKPYML